MLTWASISCSSSIARVFSSTWCRSQGWGRAAETFSVREELAAYGASPDWFTLGDRDFATHILRSQLLADGQPLSAVTETLCRRWQPGVRLLPMSDDPIETHVVLKDHLDERTVVHFQEWWVRLQARGRGQGLPVDPGPQVAQQHGQPDEQQAQEGGPGAGPDPGLVQLHRWRAGTGDPGTGRELANYGGLGRKP